MLNWETMEFIILTLIVTLPIFLIITNKYGYLGKILKWKYAKRLLITLAILFLLIEGIPLKITTDQKKPITHRLVQDSWNSIKHDVQVHN